MDLDNDVSTVLATIRTETESDDLASLTYQLEDFSERKLWHQLIISLEEFYKNESTSVHLKKTVYNQFIAKFTKKLNSIKVIDLLLQSFADDKAECLSKLLELEPRISDSDSAVYIKLQVARYYILIEQLDKANEILEQLESKFNTINNEFSSKINSAYYLTKCQLFKVKENYNSFYSNGLLYLSTIEDLNEINQLEFCFDLALSALLGDKIYNFGELILHDILNCLKTSPYDWLYNLILTLNAGNLAGFHEWLSTSVQKFPKLNSFDVFLKQKIIIMSLVELISVKSTLNKQLGFKEISEFTNTDINDVELLIIKCFSLNLFQGHINQIDQVLTITWLQPRILNLDQIKTLYDHLNTWNAQVDQLSKELKFGSASSGVVFVGGKSSADRQHVAGLGGPPQVGDAHEHDEINHRWSKVKCKESRFPAQLDNRGGRHTQHDETGKENASERQQERQHDDLEEVVVQLQLDDLSLLVQIGGGSLNRHQDHEVVDGHGDGDGDEREHRQEGGAGVLLQAGRRSRRKRRSVIVGGNQIQERGGKVEARQELAAQHDLLLELQHHHTVSERDQEEEEERERQLGSVQERQKHHVKNDKPVGRVGGVVEQVVVGPHHQGVEGQKPQHRQQVASERENSVIFSLLVESEPEQGDGNAVEQGENAVGRELGDLRGRELAEGVSKVDHALVLDVGVVDKSGHAVESGGIDGVRDQRSAEMGQLRRHDGGVGVVGVDDELALLLFVTDLQVVDGMVVADVFGDAVVKVVADAVEVLVLEHHVRDARRGLSVGGRGVFVELVGVESEQFDADVGAFIAAPVVLGVHPGTHSGAAAVVEERLVGEHRATEV